MTAAKTALLDAAREFGGDALRDLFVFDRDAHEPAFLREDVARRLSGENVARYIDDER